MVIAIVGAIAAVVVIAIATFDDDFDNSLRTILVPFVVIVLITFTAIFLYNNDTKMKIAKGEIEIYPLMGKDSTVVDYQVIYHKTIKK